MREATTSVAARTTGLDVGDQYSYYHVLEACGTTARTGRIRTTPEALQKFFGKQRHMRVVLEIGMHSPWISRLLEAVGHEVIVANARRVALIARNNSKTDRIDAELLARLGRTDPKLLQPVRHRNEQSQANLALMRSRENLVQVRTKLVNHARGILKSFGRRFRACSTESFHKLDLKETPETLRPALEPIFRVVENLTLEIRRFDKQIEEIARQRYPETQLLRQVVGVGPLTSLGYVLTVEDPHRFPKSRTVGSYLGLRPKQQDSSTARPQLRITKEGSPLVRRLLVGSAHYILGPFGPDTDLRRWGLRLCEVGGGNAKKRAVVAVARKLAVLLHRLWITGAQYDPLRQAKRAEARRRALREAARPKPAAVRKRAYA